VEAADDSRAGMVSATHLEVRRAGPEDAPAIAAVLHESFVEFKALYTEGGFAATTPGTEQVLTRMREGPIWVALREGAVMGTVAAVVKDESVYVRGMAVSPAARAAGAGTALLQHVEGWASSQGSGRLLLSTTPFLSSAIRLYERYGFRRTDEGLHDLFGTPLFTMEKAVERPPPSS
jgi:GNAT superfamily N-acetyltransferase